jgi:hypothetical protein
MTGPEHYREAERLITEARITPEGFTPNASQSYAQTIAEAQVHAVLALAAATRSERRRARMAERRR